MKVVIAEKPDLAKAIVAAIGKSKKENGYFSCNNGEYAVTWCYGHMLTLMSPEDYNPDLKKWQKDTLPIYFDGWRPKPSPDKVAQLKVIQSLLKQADLVIHAGDIDEEGQLIVDEILTLYKYKGPVKRLVTDVLLPETLRAELSKLQDNAKWQPMGRAAYARAVADFMVGINYSRFFTLAYGGKTTLTVGRVQTPTLGLVVNRDALIDGHKKSVYYELQMNSVVSDKKTNTTVTLQNKERFVDKSEPTKIGARLENGTFPADVKKKEVVTPPPLPFNLVTLQSYAGSAFGFSTEKTLNITQSLRQNYHAISYNRSDCQYLSTEHYAEAPSVMKYVLQNLGVTSTPVNMKLKSACFDDSRITAHHAIIPTATSVNVSKMSPDEQKIYTAICALYVAQFLPPQKKETTTLLVTTPDGVLKASSDKILSLGYYEYIKDFLSMKKPPVALALSDVPEGKYQTVLNQPRIVEKEDKPPARYTDHALNKDMTCIAKYVKDPEIKKLLLAKDKDKKGENGSIGTEATRSSIIQGLIKRGYIEVKGKNIISTPFGRAYYNSLPDAVKLPDMTAKWWVLQEDIKENKKKPKEMLESVLSDIKTVISQSYATPQNLPSGTNGNQSGEPSGTSLGKCPLCGSNVTERPKTFGCSNKGCNFVVWKENGLLAKSNKKLTAAMMKTILSKGKVSVKGLTSKSGSKYDAFLVLEAKSDGFSNLNLEFPPRQQKQ